MHSRSSDSTPRQAPDAPGNGDPLAAVIALLRPRTVLSKIVSGRGAWSIRYDAHEEPGFCLMLEGACFLDVKGTPPVDLAAGDFVLLPATPGFTLSSDRRLKPTLVTPVQTKELRHGDRAGPPTMRMLGGYFHFDRESGPLLVKLLPAIVHVTRDAAGATRLRGLVALITDETAAKRPARELILDRLVELLLVEALRFRPTATERQEEGLLAGLADPGLARALQRIHADVARRWTVQELARAAGMSRAVFAERFTRKVGIPPMQYVLEWRIALAKEALRGGRVPLAEVAEQVGYQSASAFSTAFTRHAGCTPSGFARRAR